ncbi:MAG: hypothetical protein C0506_01785 [Anaerolinea sp.]|nr:hypothetical protein [Anaerolinea sp.]
MLRIALLLPVAALFLAACGGGGDDSSEKPGRASSSDSVGGGARAMAAAMETEFVRLKDCYQAQKDGKGECNEDLLTNRVSVLCSAVRSGKSNEFAVADLTPFEPACSSWSALLSTPAAERPVALAGMIDKVKAIN